MAVLLNQLRLDHINLSRLLNLLEVDITALQSGEKADYLRMQDIMKYMIDYPDVFHHRCEEVLFDKLHNLGRKESAAIAQLRSEHLYLVELGQKLADLLKHATGGHIVSREDILNAAEEYWKIMRNHVITEEREIYPLIEANLSKKDWDDAVAKIGEFIDPIFGGPVDDEYRQLFDSITRQKAAG